MNESLNNQNNSSENTKNEWMALTKMEKKGVFERLREVHRKIGSLALKIWNKNREESSVDNSVDQVNQVEEISDAPSEINEETIAVQEPPEETEEERRQREERESLEKDFVEAMDKYRSEKYGKTEVIDGQLVNTEEGAMQRGRVQEISERAFNRSLTSLEDIEAYVESGDKRVSVREVEFEGKKVKIYDLEGLPFKGLLHAIDFRGYGGAEDSQMVGSEMAKQLQDNPVLWARKKEGIRVNSQDGDSDCISTTFFDTNSNMFGLGGTGGRYFAMKYGFSHVDPDSIIQISKIDGVTARDVGDNSTRVSASDYYMPEELAEKSTSVKNYNEVQIRRYDENGNPKLPDYMLVNDEGRKLVRDRGIDVMPVMLRHAAYFNVPIINIKTPEYAKQRISVVENEIDALYAQGENVSYDKVREVQQEIMGLSIIGGNKDVRMIGYSPAINVSISGASGEESKKKIDGFLEYEKKMRTEYIKNQLADAITKLEEGKEQGLRWSYEVGKGIDTVKRYDERGEGGRREGARFEIVYSLGNGKNEKAVFVDGDRYGDLLKNQTENGSKMEAESEEYNELLPLVNQYLDTMIRLYSDEFEATEEMRRRERAGA